MTFRELTVLQEKSRMRTIQAQLCTGGNEWLEPTGSQPGRDRGRRWIAAGDGLRPEMVNKRWIPSGDGSRHDMDRDRIWMDDWIWMDDQRWMTGDGSQEMDHWRRMATNPVPFYEDIEVMRSYTILEITTLISNYEVTLERRYADIRCTGGIAPPSTIPSTTQSTIPRCRIKLLYARLTMPSTIPDQIPSHTATMPIPHIMKPYEISLWRSNDL